MIVRSVPLLRDLICGKALITKGIVTFRDKRAEIVLKRPPALLNSALMDIAICERHIERLLSVWLPDFTNNYLMQPDFKSKAAD